MVQRQDADRSGKRKPSKSGVYNVKGFSFFGHAACSAGRRVAFALERIGRVVGVNTDLTRPAFGFFPKGYASSPHAQGNVFFEIYGVGRIISHVPKWGICEADDISFHGTFD